MSKIEAIEPSFTLWEPQTPSNYLAQIERATRVCYKSDDKITETSAEPLLTKIVHQLGHVSVIEHSNIAVTLTSLPGYINTFLLENVLQYVPLFKYSRAVSQEVGHPPQARLLLSGNIRMWLELLATKPDDPILQKIESILSKEYPFFFKKTDLEPDECFHSFERIDNNPLTTTLTREEMLKHCSLTGMFITDRGITHEIVRHRLCAYSQSSTRYINYGKKPYQFIIPEAIPGDMPGVEWGPRQTFMKEMRDSYDNYLELLEKGTRPEIARYLLTHATAAELVVTSTLDNWAHMFKMRGRNKAAHPEVRKLFLSAEEQINELLGWSPYKEKYGTN